MEDYFFEVLFRLSLALFIGTIITMILGGIYGIVTYKHNKNKEQKRNTFKD